MAMLAAAATVVLAMNWRRDWWDEDFMGAMAACFLVTLRV